MSEVRMYVVYDGRAASGDTENASILLATMDLEEVKQTLPYLGDAVVFSYREVVKDDGSHHLEDQRLEDI